jgi:pimeloyl-ACP methyl ester carboxylesterase
MSPELDRSSDTFRLVYYDQRGRGRSAKGVSAADVTIASEVSDLDTGAETVAIGRGMSPAVWWVLGGPP